MNCWFIFLGVVLFGSRGFAGEVNSTSVTNLNLGSFELKDQFNETQRFVFPRTNLLVLTVADQKGSEQVASWVRPLKERFPNGLPIEGVADLSIVPAFLRPLVRREFKSKFEHPVMLDWSGTMVKRLNCRPRTVNVFAVATNGSVLWISRGAAETNKLAELIRLIEAHRIGAASPEFDEAMRLTAEQRRPGEGTR